ncbi:F-box domain containing protein [Tanacetum coccineum]
MDIMNRLPVKSLLQFRTVSKKWKFSIDNFEFICNYGVRERNSCCFNLSYKHDNHGFMYLVDENLAFRHMDSNLNIISLTPVASSEGVWCFAFGDNSMLLLWNPSIKKSVGMSVPNYTFQPDLPKMIFGFGIRPVTLKPTILKINYPLYSDGPWFYNDDGISNKIYTIVLFDLVTHQFHVQDMPEHVRVREFSPPYYISQLGDSLIISGSFDFGNFHIIYAWALEVEGGFVSSCSLLFTIPHPAGHYLKLLGFSKDNQPIVEATIVQQWYRSLQVLLYHV